MSSHSLSIADDSANKKRTSKGRQKIPIVKVQDTQKLQVSFSKRRAGLFNKAGELCVLCGAQIAVIVFSPKGRPYYFAYPDVYSVIHRFITSTAGENFNSLTPLPLIQNPNYGGLNRGYEDSLDELKEERKRSYNTGVIDNGIGSDHLFWWDLVDFENLGEDELGFVVKAMEDFKKNVNERMKLLTIDPLVGGSVAVVTPGFKF